MSTKDKGWTLVNEDGSLESDTGTGCRLSTRSKSKNARESDSDQDFEILARSGSNKVISQKGAMFKGIYIKEDHFSDHVDDGSDIEVIRKIDRIKDNSSDSDDKEEVEILDPSKLDPIVMVSSDYDFEKVEPVGHILSEEALDDIFGLRGTILDESFMANGCLSNESDDDEFEGLVELFEQGHSDEEDALLDIAALFEGHYDTDNQSDNDSYPHEAMPLSDGIVLSTSMFIILLCLSLSAGFLIGKGLSFVSQNYIVINEQTSTNMDVQMPNVHEPVQENRNSKSHSSVINDTSYRNLPEEAIKLKNESQDAMKMRVAYQEMQLKYLRLEKMYRNLDQQYRTQKQIMLFTKKLQNLNTERHDKDTNHSDTANQSNVGQELLWWKMRTAVWRRKYLDLKVMFLEAQKELNRSRSDSTSFKTCASMLTRFVPELNVTALLANNRIAIGARMCWRKVLNPVRKVGEQMGSGFYGFSRKMDGFWEEMKNKWGNSWSDRKHENDDMRGKMTSKWRRFRRMFRMSNIVGSFVSKKQHGNQKEQSNKAYCHKNPMEHSEEFIERWNHDASMEDISYPPPQKPQNNKVIASTPNNDQNDEGVVAREKVHVGTEESLTPCIREENEDNSESLKEEKELRNTGYETKMDAEKKNGLQQKVDEFEKYREERNSDLRKKREILEKKMRQHSNKKREEKTFLKKQEKKLEMKMKRLQARLQRVIERKIKELENKKKRIEKELEKSIQRNKKEKVKLDKEKSNFRTNVQKIHRKLKNAEDLLRKRQADFDKWREDMRGKIARENAERFSRSYNEQMKWKQQHFKMAEKIKENVKRQQAKIEKKNLAVDLKVEQLRDALRRLLQEEMVKNEEIKKRTEELRVKESQVEMVKLFYADSLKREKEKHEQAKEMVWQMKQRVIKLKEFHDEILTKYKNVHEKLSKEREKLKSEESKSEESKSEVYHPFVYCPDQNSCQGKIKVEGKSYSKVTAGSTPIVFCPSKDSCAGNDDMKQQLEDFQQFLKKQRAAGSEFKVVRQKTAHGPVPPNSNNHAKANPFFVGLNANDNLTSTDEESRPHLMRPEAEQVDPKMEEVHEGEQDSHWYFSLMKERAKQRAVPLSWYMYWSQGRSNWRHAPGKDSDDNWYLKFMQERERQRSMPVDWYFKRGKGREEGHFSERDSWFFSRGKGREEARKKEGFYYCW